MSARLPVTVVIPVRNEERNLPGCLACLARFERVVVVDSRSSDRTQAIAREHGADIVEFEWDGRFPKKRNWVLRTHPPTTPWVFFLDADEYVNDEFCNELERLLPTTTHAGFWIHYDNWFMGRRLMHGDGNRKLALFRVGAGEYERIEEDHWSGLDMEVHEHPMLEGTVGDVHTRLLHRDYRGLELWLRRHNDYSSWEARRILALRDGGESVGQPTVRQRWKYAAIGRAWLPVVYFFDVYVRRLGWLDGHAGFCYALLKANYLWEIGLKVREFSRNDKA